jgi:hypothetical protein
MKFSIEILIVIIFQSRLWQHWAKDKEMRGLQGRPTNFVFLHRNYFIIFILPDQMWHVSLTVINEERNNTVPTKLFGTPPPPFSVHSYGTTCLVQYYVQILPERLGLDIFSFFPE